MTPQHDLDPHWRQSSNVLAPLKKITNQHMLGFLKGTVARDFRPLVFLVFAKIFKKVFSSALSETALSQIKFQIR